MKLSCLNFQTLPEDSVLCDESIGLPPHMDTLNIWERVHRGKNGQIPGEECSSQLGGRVPPPWLWGLRPVHNYSRGGKQE